MHLSLIRNFSNVRLVAFITHLDRTVALLKYTPECFYSPYSFVNNF